MMEALTCCRSLEVNMNCCVRPQPSGADRRRLEQCLRSNPLVHRQVSWIPQMGMRIATAWLGQFTSTLVWGKEAVRHTRGSSRSDQTCPSRVRQRSLSEREIP